tara:strand:+ start:11038 stop:12261 length:1224 start_codon:yes stop_codon:yes gene_type:complete
MTKYKILVIPSDRTGVSKFRSVDPHLCLQKLYPEEFWVDIDYEPKLDDENFLKKYDLIHYHRSLHPDYNISQQVSEKLNKLGIPAIMDIDDYWLPNSEHPAYMLVKQRKMDELIIENLKRAQHVVTTTPIFAQEIKRFCPSVFVLENAIDPREKQFTPKPEESDRIRIGWLGGSSHMADLENLRGVAGRLTPLKDKIQFVLCGFDTRGNVTMIDEKTGQQKTRDITPKESVWYRYEQLFTDNHKWIEGEQNNIYSRFKFGEEYSDTDTSYRRVWTKPITTYAENYNKFDISLAPLKHHTFNKVKSQLKVIEAGFHKKALIAQDFGPYQIDCINAYERGGTFNKKGNSLLIAESKNHKQWFQHIKRLVNNPSLITDLGERLFEDVQKYHIDRVTERRAQIYRDLISKA